MKNFDQRLSSATNYTTTQDTAAIKQVAEKSWHVLNDIINFIQPGVSEEDVHTYIKACYEKHQVQRIWHQPYVRFGEHSLLTFLEKNPRNNILKEEDIAFVDIGIVFDGIEGDVGKTIRFGNNTEHKAIIEASETLFQEGRKFWMEENATGIQLYAFLRDQAKAMGYEFNLPKAGHLIGSFSHAATGYRDGLNYYPKRIENNRWILEIQIKHQSLPIGAFYEDLLSSD